MITAVTLAMALTAGSAATGATVRDIGSFEKEFNAAKGSPRVVTILSPTWGPCLRGARVVRDDLAKAFPDAKAKFFVIWVPMLGNENRDHAVKQSETFGEDDRFAFYWDEEKTVPDFLGPKMDLPNDRRQAWDVYLLYDKDAVWGKEPPKPVFWMHQLGRDERLLDPVRLKKAFESMIDPKHEIVFLTREGCAGTPLMRERLEEALREKGLPEAYRTVDLADVDEDDVRIAYGTPTVLVDGKDLMGAPKPTEPGFPTWRAYPGGVPSVEEIMKALPEPEKEG